MASPLPNRSLRCLVESIATRALSPHRDDIDLEIDIDPSIILPAAEADMTQLLQVLVGQSLREIQAGELSIIAWQGPHCLELEIADSGCPVEDRAASLPMIAAKLGAQTVRQNCPQGGAAVTVRFPQRAARREAA